MTSGIKFPRTHFSEQEVLNFGLDDIEVAPTSMRGGLQWVEGLGWIRSPVNGVFPYEQYDYTSGNLDYKGINTDSSAADADTDWVIWKFTWSSGNCTKIQMLVGSWTGRAGLSW